MSSTHMLQCMDSSPVLSFPLYNIYLSVYQAIISLKGGSPGFMETSLFSPPLPLIFL